MEDTLKKRRKLGTKPLGRASLDGFARAVGLFSQYESPQMPEASPQKDVPWMELPKQIEARRICRGTHVNSLPELGSEAKNVLIRTNLPTVGAIKKKGSQEVARLLQNQLGKPLARTAMQTLRDMAIFPRLESASTNPPSQVTGSSSGSATAVSEVLVA